MSHYFRKLSTSTTMYGGIVACAYQKFCFLCACSLIFFHCRSFSPCWPLGSVICSLPLWNFHFFSTNFHSFVFNQSLWSFRCYPRECKHKKITSKDSTLLLFFLSKSPGGHAISFQMKPWIAFGLPYLLIELFYIGVPLVRTDGWSGDGGWTYDHVTTKILGCIGHRIF